MIAALLVLSLAGAATLDHIEVLHGQGPTSSTIVVVHGYGHSPEGIRDLFADYPAPALLVMPRGPDRVGRGWGWFSGRSALSDPDRVARELSHAADRLTLFIESLDVKDPVLTGFSQGGMLSYAVAVLHPDSIGLSVPISGWLPPGLIPDDCPTNAPPIRAFHGDADDILPIGPTRTSVGSLQELGYDVTLTEYAGVRHSTTPAMRSEVFSVILQAAGQTVPSPQPAATTPAPGASPGVPSPDRPGISGH